jgi:hypothetical protein
LPGAVALIAWRPGSTGAATPFSAGSSSRVTVTPEDPADLQRLQSSVRTHVERMSATGSCGMGGRTEHGDAQHQDEQYQQEEREQRQQQGQQ